MTLIEMMKARVWILRMMTLTLWVWAACVLARNGGSPIQPRGRDEERGVKLDMDATHENLSRKVGEVSRGLDRLFVTEHYIENTDESYVRLRLGFEIQESGVDFKNRASVKLYLPNLENRFQIFFESLADDTPQGAIEDVPAGITGSGERETVAGLRFSFYNEDRKKVDLDGGVRFRSGLVPYTRLRLQRTFFHEASKYRFQQDFFWYSDDGIGTTSRADWDRLLDDHFFIRTGGNVTWSETSQGVDWYVGTALLQYQFEERKRAYGIGLNANGYSRPDWTVDRIALFFKYRQQFLRKWLFLELQPELRLPESSNYEPTPVLTIQLEMILGRYQAYYGSDAVLPNRL